METNKSKKTSKAKKTTTKKAPTKPRVYKGTALRKFGFSGKFYEKGDAFETTDKKQFDNLINNKRIF